MAEDIKKAREDGLSIPVIASIAGASPEEFAEMAREFERKGASAVELNLVCPNRGRLVGRSQEETLGQYWAETPERSYRVVKAVKDAVGIPVWAKFPFETVYRKPLVIRKMQESGAAAAVVTTSMPKAMAIDLTTGRPRLGNPRGAGAVGGRIMKPLGINCVSELSRIVGIPVIATGGVFSGLDVIEYMMVGAHAVGVLTAFMHKIPVREMLYEIEEFLSLYGYDNLQTLRGKTLDFLPPLTESA
jgi:dihydroorotate dehydrogenase (NAD+) catalytic subunit